MNKILLYLFFLLSSFKISSQTITINEAGGWLESAFVKWSPVAGATSYNVYYTGGGQTNKQIDTQLIRNYGSYFRADIPGLSAGTYTVKISPVTASGEGNGTITNNITVVAQDRNGFAFSGGRIPGGYNLNGTAKTGAVILYITQNTKNTISFNVTGATVNPCVGFQNILYAIKKGIDTRPFIFRMIGNITDMDVMEGGDIVIENSNNASSSVTIEGVGSDAVANGFGIRIKSASNIEIRNIGFMLTDAAEGDNVGLQQANDHIWVHNCDLFYGSPGGAADQIKGDGALDCKKSTYCTFSYNHFWDSGKCNLLGLSENTTTDLYVTYHHNWYDHSDSRHPRVRFYSAHVYNNYFDGNSKYGAGSTLGSSVFMEGNFFRNCKYPMLTSMQGSDTYAGAGNFSGEDGGTIKAFDNMMSGQTRYVSYNAVTNPIEFDAIEVASRGEIISSSIVSKQGANTYNNFDTDPTLYIKNLTIESPTVARDNVILHSGRVSGGDLIWSFNNTIDDASYSVNSALNTALTTYTSGLVAVQGETTSITNNPTLVSTTDNNQTVTSGTAISPMVFIWGGDATDVNVTGLPAFGISFVKDILAKTITISGTPSANLNFSITTAGSLGTPLIGTGSITINTISPIIPAGNEVHNFTVSGKISSFYTITGNMSSTPGLVSYDGLALTARLKIESTTSITYTTTALSTLTLVFDPTFVGKIKLNGVSYTAVAGIVTIPSIPAGVNTILKTDTANLYYIKSVYNSTSLSGSFYVDADSDGYTVGPAVTLTYNTTTPSGYTTNSLGSDCNDANNAVWQSGSFYTDVDGDGYTVGSSVTLCYGATTPSGYVTSSLGSDCNDANNAVWQSGSFYADADADGYTVGSLVTLCYGATTPSGYATSSLGSDCDDTKNTVWQSGSFYTDVDGDGYTVGSSVTLCYGATTPSGYSTTSLGFDCDDTKNTVWQSGSFYTDADADGYTVGSLVTLCYGATTPSGYVTSTLGFDCDDTKNTVWQSGSFYTDVDGDGYTVGSLVTLCYGATTPSGYSTTSLGIDCDDTKNTVWQSGSFYADADADGYTVGSLVTLCYGATTPSGYVTSSLGSDCDDTKNTVWQSGSFYADADADGYTVGSLVTLCYGATIPSGYSTTSLGFDCDDTKNTVSSGVTITSQPLNPTICKAVGATATISVVASGSSQVTYQWYSQAATATTWTTLLNSTNYTGVNGAVLTITRTTTTLPATGTKYRVIVSGGQCGVATSDTVSLQEIPTAVAGVITSPTAVCLGDSITFTSGVYTGSAIQWEVSTVSTTSGFVAIAGANGTSFTMNAIAYASGSKFYVRNTVTSGSCSTAISAVKTITVNAVSVSGTISGGGTICSLGGGTLKIAGYVGSIQWQYSTDGLNYSNVPTSTTVSSAFPFSTTSTSSISSTYIVTNVTASTYFRAKITSGVCSSAYSNAVSFTIAPVAIAGTAVVGSTNICAASATTLSLTNYLGTITWQKSTNWTAAVPTWASVTGGTTANVSTGALTVSTAFRAMVTIGTCSTVYSATTIVTVSPAAVGGTVAVNVAGTDVCLGSSKAMKVTGYIGTIQWQMSTDGGTTYSDVAGATTTPYTFTSINSNTLFRVVATSGVCVAKAYSNAVQITVTTIPAIAGVITGNSSVCSATSPGSSLTLTGSQGSIIWQKSTNWTATAPTWTTVTGATATVLSTGSLTVASAYKALLTSGSCVATTPTFVVTVSPKIVAKAIAANVTVPAGTTTTSALCTTDTTKILTLATGYVGAIQWQTAATATGPWVDIAGANSATYAVSNPIVGANYYRVKLTSSPCSEGYSTNVLTVWYKTCVTAIVKDQLMTNAYSLKAFPNPFDDTFIIETISSSKEMLQIAVYDISGKQIDSQKVAADLLSTVVFGKQYAAGVYSVIVQEGDKKVTLRMIKR